MSNPTPQQLASFLREKARHDAEFIFREELAKAEHLTAKQKKDFLKVFSTGFNACLGELEAIVLPNAGE